jgi:signal transduction histidine kinase
MPARVRRRLLDVAPTVCLLALGLVELFVANTGSEMRAPREVDTLFLFAVCLPLVVRRRHPLLAFLAVFVAQAAWSLAYYTGAHQPPFEPFVAGMVACFALGFHADLRRLRYGVLAFALTGVIALLAGGVAVGNTLPAVIWWSGAIAIGYVLRGRQTLVELLRERSAGLERARARDVAEATLEERARIARELHDVIAHSVSLIVVQAGAERRLLPAGQRRTADVLETIEEAGREALGELRRLLGVLRARGDAGRLAPQPGLAALPDLLDEGRRGGQAIGYEVEGDPVRLSAGLDLTAYRIVQEALTNARKYAPGAAATVALRWRAAALEIEVLDNGPRAASEANGVGHGLIGMRERAALYGGSIEAAPVPDGGFRVHARLPIARGVSG